MTLRLGKKPATPDPRDIKLSEIVDVELVHAKPYVPHDKGYVRQMYSNGPDSTAPIQIRQTGIGCCEFSRMSNAIQLMRHAAGKKAARLNGTTCQQAYSEVTHYVLGDDATDQGTDMGESAKWWRKTGMKDLDGVRHTIAAYATFNPSDVAELDAAIKTFDFAGLGVQLQQIQMSEFPKEWTYSASSPVIGGHAINYCAPERIDSWAKEVTLQKAFIQHQADEAFVYVSTEIFNGESETPEGLNLAALKKALAAL